MLHKLYSDIGGKLKRLAICTFIVEFIASIVAFFVFAEDVWMGLLILFGGALVSFVSTWFLYAFGELVSRVCSIDDNLHALSLSAHEQMNRNMYEVEARIRREAEEKARKAAEEQAAKRKAQWDSVAQATVKTVDIVGEEIAQTASTVSHFVAEEYSRIDTDKIHSTLNPTGFYNSSDERAKRKAEWEAEVQKRKEAEDRARQVVEERMRRMADERAKQNADQT